MFKKKLLFPMCHVQCFHTKINMKSYKISLKIHNINKKIFKYGNKLSKTRILNIGIEPNIERNHIHA